MPDPNEKGGSTEEQPTPQGQPAEDPTRVPPTDPAADPNNPQPPGEVVLTGSLKGVTTREDGTLEYKAGSTVYLGKDLDELWDNIGKGITSKDEQYAALRREKTTKLGKDCADRHAQTDKEEEEEPLPDEQEVFQKALASALKQHPEVRPEMLRWTNEQWKEYQKTNELEGWEIMDLRLGAKEVVQKAQTVTNAQLNQSSALALNRQTIRDESEAISQLVEEAGLWEHFTEELFGQILERAVKVVNKNGIIKSGAVTAEATKEITKMLKSNGKSAITKSLEAEAKKGDEAKSKIPGSGGAAPGAPTRKPAQKVADTYEEAALRVLGKERAAV